MAAHRPSRLPTPEEMAHIHTFADAAVNVAMLTESTEDEYTLTPTVSDFGPLLGAAWNTPLRYLGSITQAEFDEAVEEFRLQGGGRPTPIERAKLRLIGTVASTMLRVFHHRQLLTSSLSLVHLQLSQHWQRPRKSRFSLKRL